MGFNYAKDAMRNEPCRQARRMQGEVQLAENKRGCADKTPHYIAIFDGLRDVFAPDARFVMIYRDPFNVVV